METKQVQQELQSQIDKLTGTAIRDGNAAEFMPSGSVSYKKRWELLEKAQKSINIVAFSLMRDETSARLCDILRRKLQQGVAVKMIFDDAVIYSTFSGGLLRKVSRAGGEVIRYHRLFRDIFPARTEGRPFQHLVRNLKIKLKRRFHEKYMVVDGCEAILGGINWGNKYSFGGIQAKAWRDTDVYLTGPVVADIQNQFIKDCFLYRAMEEAYGRKNEKGFDLVEYLSEARKKADAFIAGRPEIYFPDLTQTGEERIRYVPHKPWDEGRLRLTNALLLMFRNARRYIYWGCHGVRPPRIVAETLAEAVKRGVKVLLISNSQVSSRTLMGFGLLGWMYQESKNHFRWLIEHSIKVYEWQKPGAFHSKNLVIDDEVASIGSFNIASGSTFHHTESNVMIYGGPLPLRVREQFEIDLRDCREVTLEQTKTSSQKHDPYLRPLHERYLLIERSLLTDSMRNDLDAGNYVNKWR